MPTARPSRSDELARGDAVVTFSRGGWCPFRDLQLRSYQSVLAAHHTLAVAALFLVDKQGVVRWAHADPTFTVRPTTARILGALDAAHASAP